MANYSYLRLGIIRITHAVRKGSQNLGNKKPMKYVIFFSSIDSFADWYSYYFSDKMWKRKIDCAQYKMWVAGDNK